MRYDLESTLPERAFKKSLFKNAPATLEGGGKGGGTPAPTQATSYQTNVPEYAKPYVQNMLNATQNQLFNTQKTTNPDTGETSTEITGFKPFKPYSSSPSDYYAGFSPLQQQAQSGAANMQMPGQIADASNMAQQAGLEALNSSYNPMSAGYNQVRGAQAQAAQLGNSPQAQAAAMQAAQLGGAPLAQASQFGGPQNVNAQNVGTQDFTGQNVQNYMSPYLQGALDPQIAEMRRQYGITGAQQQSQAAKQGAFGGSREALMAAENQRNLNTAIGSTLGQGYQNAFQNAQQQFNAQQQANLQAQQANQGANLQAGLANQQMGYNTGLQNAQLQQQTNLANQGLLGQYGLQQGQFGQAANQFNAANQQQANLANQQLAGQYGLQQGQFGQAANLANQQSRNQAALANQQAALQAQQANIGQQQFGANYRMQGLQQANQAAQNLGQLGGQQLSGQQSIYNMQNQLGGQQQALEQSKINQAVQDYGTAQQYPMMQLGLMSNMLRGLPMQSTAVQSYQAQAPVAQQAAGLLGAYNAYAGKKKGGEIKAMAKGGIADIPRYKSGVLVGLENKIDDIAQSDAYAQQGQKQLPKLMQQTTSPGIKQLIATKQAEDQLGQNMSGVAAGNTGDLGMNMAEGGIIPRFATGTEVKDPYGLNAAAAEATKGFATPQEALATQQALMSSGLQNVQANLSPEELEQQKYVQERRAGLSDKQRRAERMNEALAFLKFGSTVGGLGTAATEGAKSYMLGQGEIQNKYDDLNDSLIKQAAEIKKAQRAEAKGDIDKAQTHYEKAESYKLAAVKDNATLLNTLETHRMDNASRERSAATTAAAHNAARKFEEDAVRDYAETHKVSIGDALAVFKGVGNKDATLKLNAAHFADQTLGTGGMATQYMALLNSKKPEDREKAKTMRQDLINEYLAYANSGSSLITPPPPASTKDKGTVDTKNPLLGGK